MPESWSRCSSCKSEIAYLTTYWVCSVSTCTRKRTGMVFCSVSCWEMHLPMMRHREAFAVEERSPSREAHLAELAAEAGGAATSAAQVSRSPAPMPSSRPAPASSNPAPVIRSSAPTPSSGGGAAPPSPPRRLAVEPPPAPPAPIGEAATDEILVVVSKLKKYVRDRSGMNTSDGVVEALSDHLRWLCDEAVRSAGRDGRKTIMERDFIMLTRAVERR